MDIDQLVRIISRVLLEPQSFEKASNRICLGREDNLHMLSVFTFTTCKNAQTFYNSNNYQKNELFTRIWCCLQRLKIGLNFVIGVSLGMKGVANANVLPLLFLCAYHIQVCQLLQHCMPTLSTLSTPFFIGRTLKSSVSAIHHLPKLPSGAKIILAFLLYSLNTLLIVILLLFIAIELIAILEFGLITVAKKIRISSIPNRKY